MIAAKYTAYAMRTLPDSWQRLVDDVLRYFDKWDKDQILGPVPAKDKEILVSYHLLKGSLVVSRNDEAKVDGVLMFYRYGPGWDWDTIDNWVPDQRDGKSLVVGWMHSQGGRATVSLGEQLKEKVPDWKGCDLFGLRKGKVKRYDNSTFSRILKFNN